MRNGAQSTVSFCIMEYTFILYTVRGEVSDKKAAIHKRGIWSMTHEWRAHNLLYSLGIKRDRTKDVDLDVNQPWYIKVAYSVLSIFYPHF